MRRINSVECLQMRQSLLRTTPLESNYLHLAIDLNIFTLYESEAKAKGLLQQVRCLLKSIRTNYRFLHRIGVQTIFWIV
jgi:hypothetical protein